MSGTQRTVLVYKKENHMLDEIFAAHKTKAGLVFRKHNTFI